jgi:hypothetical protein
MKIKHALFGLLVAATSAFSTMRTIQFVPDHITVGNTGNSLMLFIGSNSVLSGTALAVNATNGGAPIFSWSFRMKGPSISKRLL